MNEGEGQKGTRWRPISAEKGEMSKMAGACSITIAVQLVCGRKGQFSVGSVRNDGLLVNLEGISSGLKPRVP